jgi:hypothetical protein
MVLKNKSPKQLLDLKNIENNKTFEVAEKAKKKNWLQRISITELMIVSLVTLFVDLIVQGSAFAVIGCTAWGLIALTFMLASQTNFFQHKDTLKFIHKYGVVPLLFVGALLVFLTYILAEPSHAQFFVTAETKVKTALDTALAGNTALTQTKNIIGLLFTILRIVLLIYLGVSFVRIIGAAREDDDWKALARTPLLILVVLAVADFVSTLII